MFPGNVPEHHGVLIFIVELKNTLPPSCECAKLLHLCWTLCDAVDRSLPGSFVHGILQARILEWVAMPSSRGSSWARDQTCLYCTGRIFFVCLPLNHLRSSDLVRSASRSCERSACPEEMELRKWCFCIGAEWRCLFYCSLWSNLEKLWGSCLPGQILINSRRQWVSSFVLTLGYFLKVN